MEQPTKQYCSIAALTSVLLERTTPRWILLRVRGCCQNLQLLGLRPTCGAVDPPAGLWLPAGGSQNRWRVQLPSPPALNRWPARSICIPPNVSKRCSTD